MRDTDRKAFYESWAASWEQTGKTVTERQLRFAFEALVAFELADIQGALMTHARDTEAGQFGPKAADIIRQIEGGGDERSTKAWAKLEQAVTGVGSWQPMVFDDPVIHAVIQEMGGLLVFCQATYDDWNILRSWFTRTYRGYLQRPPTVYPAVIWGSGGTMEQLVFIGDRDKARRVMTGGSEGNPMITQAQPIAALLGRLQ